MNSKNIVLVGLAGVVFSAPVLADIQFDPAQNYPTGSMSGPGPAPENTAVADVDNDGDMDVIVADLSSSGPLLLRNDGNGVLSAGERIEVGAYFAGVVNAADHDGDGNVDLLVANGYQVTVLSGDGTGAFEDVQTLILPVGGQQQAIAVDVNADAVPDIVGITLGGLRVFPGLGDGTFGPGSLHTIAGVPTAVAPANLNDDGVTDLVVSDAFGQRVIALLADGLGGFTEAGSTIVGFIPEDVRAGDINNDGIDDVVTADSFSFTITAVLSDGAGGFGSSQRYFGGFGPVSVGLVDFDGDGNLDIAEAVVGEAKVNVFPGLGDGRFATPLAVSVTPFPQTPALADLDGDGDIDMAAAGPSNVSVVKNASNSGGGASSCNYAKPSSWFYPNGCAYQ